MSFTSFVLVLNEVVLVLLLDVARETFESSLRIEPSNRAFESSLRIEPSNREGVRVPAERLSTSTINGTRDITVAVFALIAHVMLSIVRKICVVFSSGRGNESRAAGLVASSTTSVIYRSMLSRSSAVRLARAFRFS